VGGFVLPLGLVGSCVQAKNWAKNTKSKKGIAILMKGMSVFGLKTFQRN
ncbi:MAG: hypothetical protein RL555_1384, partial [Bacteroidota bacterium]